MNDNTYADEHEQYQQNTGLGWPVIRLSLHGAAAVLAVLAFAFLVLELRGEATTSTLAWMLLGFILVLLAGQVALMVFGRDRVVVAAEAPVQEEQEETWASYDAPQAEAAEAAESTWAAPESTWAEPADEMITIGCPACDNSFHMSESDVAGGTFHCPKCGVAGYLGE